MLRRLSLIAGLASLIIMASLVGTALAQGGIIVQHSDPYWQATYWNNTSLSGTPVLERQESALDYDWGTGSPDPSVNADEFSARWTRYIDVTPGTYRFTATCDDGLRLWVDGELLIDQWHDHAATTYTATKYLGAGHHLVEVQYYENRGFAVAKLSWALDTGIISAWHGEYYNNTTLSGSPALVRDDPEINFVWGNASPAPSYVNADVFSVRWTRTLSLGAGNYRFYLTIDDGGRLYVNGHLLIESWKEQPATTYYGDIYLPGGSIEVQLEYYENFGDAVAQLSWAPTSAAPSPPAPSGTVIVDDTDPGFSKGGNASSWRTVAEGYGRRLLWTFNNDWARYAYNWARWYPQLQPRWYEVFVYIPDRYTTTSQARYWISHADGYTLKIVDQSANGGRWVSLGTYRFQGTSSDYVSLSDVTFEPYLSRILAFDAVKWEPR